MHWNSRNVVAAIMSAAATTLASQAVVAQGLPLVNKGGINPSSWVYGPRTSDTTGGVIWKDYDEKLKKWRYADLPIVPKKFTSTVHTGMIRSMEVTMAMVSAQSAIGL